VSRDVCALHYLLRRKPAPVRLIADRVGVVFEGNGSRHNPNLDREPRVVIALGRWLFAPFLGGLLAATDEPDSEGATRDFDAMVAAVAQRRVP
jgi:hypothetical protein